MTVIIPDSMNPSPVILTFVLPVNGPSFGLIQKIAYGRLVIVETLRLHTSLSQLLFQPP